MSHDTNNPKTHGSVESLNGTRATRSRVWTANDVRQLGLTTDVETAGEILGIGRTTAYGLARRDQFPVTIIRIGGRYVVPTHGLLTLLGATEPAAP